jgi:hypothetical protein
MGHTLPNRAPPPGPALPTCGSAKCSQPARQGRIGRDAAEGHPVEGEAQTRQSARGRIVGTQDRPRLYPQDRPPEAPQGIGHPVPPRHRRHGTGSERVRERATRRRFDLWAQESNGPAGGEEGGRRTRAHERFDQNQCFDQHGRAAASGPCGGSKASLPRGGPGFREKPLRSAPGMRRGPVDRAWPQGHRD